MVATVDIPLTSVDHQPLAAVLLEHQFKHHVHSVSPDSSHLIKLYSFACAYCLIVYSLIVSSNLCLHVSSLQFFNISECVGLKTHQKLYIMFLGYLWFARLIKVSNVSNNKKTLACSFYTWCYFSILFHFHSSVLLFDLKSTSVCSIYRING